MSNILMSINIYHVYLTDFKVKRIRSKINKYRSKTIIQIQNMKLKIKYQGY
jgi:hypothetical protein